MTAYSLRAGPEPHLIVPLHLDRHLAESGQVPFHRVKLEVSHEVQLRFESLPAPEWLGRLVAALGCLPCQEATP